MNRSCHLDRWSKALLGLAAAIAGTPAAPLAGQVVAARDSLGPVIALVEEFVFDGEVSEWRARPVDRILAAAADRPQALVWVGQVAAGLVVAGELRSAVAAAAAPPFRISLSGPAEPELPPIGWGHQFGFEVLPDSAACADREGFEDSRACVAWYRRQQAHRVALPALFEREWSLDLAAASLSEVRAGPAFRALAQPDRLRALQPRGSPRALTREIRGTPGAVGFEVLVPWAAFPPVRAPALAAVRLDLGWSDDAPARPPTSPAGGARRSAARTSLAASPPRPLGRPLAHHVTPCHAGLAGILIGGRFEGQYPRVASEHAVAYMVPEPSLDLRRLIVIDNDAAGYQYAPDAETLSPQAYEAAYDVLDVGRGERVCAPSLALAREGRRVSPPDWTLTGGDDPWATFAELRGLEVRRDDDGDFLLLHGPRVFWSYYGSGQCGACPRIVVEVYHIDRETGRVTTRLRETAVAEPDFRDVEVEVSADWSEVTVFQSETRLDRNPPATRWSATRHCLADPQGGAPSYELCAEEQGVPEPPVRLRALYRER